MWWKHARLIDGAVVSVEAAAAARERERVEKHVKEGGEREVYGDLHLVNSPDQDKTTICALPLLPWAINLLGVLQPHSHSAFFLSSPSFRGIMYSNVFLHSFIGFFLFLSPFFLCFLFLV